MSYHTRSIQYCLHKKDSNWEIEYVIAPNSFLDAHAPKMFSLRSPLSL